MQTFQDFCTGSVRRYEMPQFDLCSLSCRCEKTNKFLECYVLWSGFRLIWQSKLNATRRLWPSLRPVSPVQSTSPLPPASCVFLCCQFLCLVISLTSCTCSPLASPPLWLPDVPHLCPTFWVCINIPPIRHAVCVLTLCFGFIGTVVSVLGEISNVPFFPPALEVATSLFWKPRGLMH